MCLFAIRWVFSDFKCKLKFFASEGNGHDDVCLDAFSKMVPPPQWNKQKYNTKNVILSINMNLNNFYLCSFIISTIPGIYILIAEKNIGPILRFKCFAK